MQRTTIGFDDDLLRRLKRRAAAENLTLQALVNDLVRQALGTARRSSYELRLAGFAADVRPGVDLADRAALFEPGAR